MTARDNDALGDEEREREVKTSRAPKMSSFNGSKADTNAYLQRFVRFAELCKWEKNDWALHLSTFLSGGPLKISAQLPADDAKDFEKLNPALL